MTLSNYNPYLDNSSADLLWNKTEIDRLCEYFYELHASNSCGASLCVIHIFLFSQYIRI